MRMSSNDVPNYLHQSNNIWFFNLNTVNVPGVLASDGITERLSSYECDSMPVVGEPSRASLISAGMQAKYSKDDEIAALNNKLVGDGTAFDLYQTYRTYVKQQVTEAGYI